MGRKIIAVLGLMVVLLISGCVQEEVKYICPDGSSVKNSYECNKQYVCQNGDIVEDRNSCPSCENCYDFWHFISGGERQEHVDIKLNYTTNIIAQGERKCEEEMLRRYPEFTEWDVFCKLSIVSPKVAGFRYGVQEFNWSYSCICFKVK